MYRDVNNMLSGNMYRDVNNMLSGNMYRLVDNILLGNVWVWQRSARSSDSSEFR